MDHAGSDHAAEATGRGDKVALDDIIPRVYAELAVAQTAPYTRDDGIVDWRYCLTGDPASDLEVQGTDIGLIFNPDAYACIVERLSARPGRRISKA